jgi:hypothetical protein
MTVDEARAHHQRPASRLQWSEEERWNVSVMFDVGWSAGLVM